MVGIQRTVSGALLLMVFCAGVLASLWLAVVAQRRIEADALATLTAVADRTTIRIEERLVSHEIILRGAAGLFGTAGRVDRQDWKDYVARIDAPGIVPGMQGIGFAAWVPPDRLQRHIDAVRAEGFPEYRVQPAGQRDGYSAIVFLEPFEGTNLRAFGYDMYSEPVRREAMARARDSGRAALSGKVVLVQETGVDVQAGALMYVPVYEPGRPTDTVEQRQAALRGWVYSPFRMGDFVSGVLMGGDVGGGGVALRIYDGAEPDAARLLHGAAAVDGGRAPVVSRRIELQGRPWLLEYQPSAGAPGPDYTLAWGVGGAGLLVSVLVFGLGLSVLQTRARAQRIADVLTHDLRERERLLQESEFRWRFAIEGSGDGLWDWSVPDGRVFFSTRWKSMLGYADFEIGDSLEEWKKRIHPDDLDAALAAVQEYLAGRADVYFSEHRVQRKDGTYLWVLDRGMVVERDRAGRPLRMIGTHTDVNQRKLLEQSLLAREADLCEAQRIARMGSWKLHFPSGRLEWSDTVQQMFGLSLGKPVPVFDALEPFFTPESWARLVAAVASARETGTPYELELEVARADGVRSWMLARGEATRDASGAITGLHGSASDITERVQARIRIEHLGKLYAALSACNWAITRVNSEAELMREVCEVVVRHGGMRMAWIGLVDLHDGRIVPRHAFGDGLDYLDGIEVSVHADDPHGRGPTGTATRENRPIWIDDFAADPVTLPWHARGSAYGWRASAAVPLCRSGVPIGALTFYSSEAGWFDSDTRSLLEEIGSNLSYALDKLDAEIEAREAQAELLESEQRFRTLVEQPIAGAFIVQDGVLEYANPRMATILGHADPRALLGLALVDLVAPSSRGLVLATLERIQAGEHSNEELLITALRQDGTTVEVGLNTAAARFGAKPAIIGLMQDISDRKVAEDQIRRYAKQLEHTFMQTVGLANTLSELRDPYTAGHERGVAGIAVAIGREMGLDEHRLEGLRVGGYLHDVGKMVVPAEILSRPARLSPVEFELVKVHPQAGFDILKEVDFPWPVAEIALQHHERMDGSGYPRGLKGEEILLEARIIAVADVVESMASHRPYRPGLGIERALAEIEDGLGTRYDPDAARACLRLFREKGLSLPAH